MNLESNFNLTSSFQHYENKIIGLISQATTDLFVQMIRSNDHKVVGTEVIQTTTDHLGEILPCQLINVRFDTGSEQFTMSGRIIMRMTLDGHFKMAGEIL